MSNHPQCDAVRLVDRCCQCNPGYSDQNQAYSIYKETKRGKSLAQAERDDVQKRRKK
jgi:hypothetical protein